MPKGIYIRTEEHKKKQAAIALQVGIANRGRHPSNETRRKLSIANLGKHLSEQTKKKISTTMSGSNNPFYGKTHSEETLNKISITQSGKSHSDETRQKMRLTHIARVQQHGVVFPNTGRNENVLLDKQEQQDSVIILRNQYFSELGFYPDGYCPETKTVYQIYERAHKRKKIVLKDNVCQRAFEAAGYKYVIIWDLTH